MAKSPAFISAPMQLVLRHQCRLEDCEMGVLRLSDVGHADGLIFICLASDSQRCACITVSVAFPSFILISGTKMVISSRIWEASHPFQTHYCELSN